MTTTIEQDIGPISTRPVKPRRIWLRIVIGVVFLAIIAVGISWEVYSHSYQPLSPGEYSVGPRGDLKSVTDGVDTATRYVMVGPPGATGRFTLSLDNTGSHPVRLVGGDQANQPYFHLQWAPGLKRTSTGIPATLGAQNPRYDFPTTLAPGHEISVFVTVMKPNCSRGQISEVDQVNLKWQALGVHHTYVFPLSASDDDYTPPVVLCAPDPANLRFTGKAGN